MKGQFRKGFMHGLPIGLGYLSVAFAFGIQAVSLGLTPLEAVLISMTNLTSAGQLAGIALIAHAAPYVEMALTQLTINLRYALMSLSLSQKMGADMSTPRRMFAALGITDEIFAVASSQTERLTFPYMTGLMVLPYIGWSAGTLLGAVAGSLLPAFVTSALGIAIYGMFLSIVIPQARRERAVCTVTVISALISLALRYMFQDLSGGYRIILCAVSASALGALWFPVDDGEGADRA